MTTRNQVPRTHRLSSILWIAAMLFLSVAASGKSIQASRCPQAQEPHKVATAWAVPAQADRQPNAGRPVPAYLTTGLDLEVRIWNVRIEFPWLKSLPVTPGRHIVVSLWETESDR